MNEIFENVKTLCLSAKAAAPTLALTDSDTRNDILWAMSASLTEHCDVILLANKKDLENAERNGVPTAMLDRLKLTRERVQAIADAIEKLTELPDPLAKSEHLSGGNPKIDITRVRVPLGLVAIIYEARPNVTADAAALCIKSGNAVVLRGGKEAIESNRAIVLALQKALAENGVDPSAISLITSTDRESANALMQMRGIVDVLIPRGGKSLIRSCVDNAKIPVIETGAGNCHIYVDVEADLSVALPVTVNAKCQRPSVCNAVETLLVHRAVAAEFLPALFEATRAWSLEFRGCPATCRILPQAIPATDEDFATEYNDYILSVKVVGNVDEAIAHIATYGTRHSEAIITKNDTVAEHFCDMVDAAAVYRNASTRFTDGGEFGFGAEIGISTQKLHARGPMGLDALTTVKYLITGNGATRG
ncbi:MAG: glutamate-5-semialdehyde dehydrogenase [Clostridia bacterium]|nr:glutamate-5-semialdehyde dehydrogenase [Clostridia bacterium]